LNRPHRGFFGLIHLEPFGHSYKCGRLALSEV
jgi:hypothetical protein